MSSTPCSLWRALTESVGLDVPPAEIYRYVSVAKEQLTRFIRRNQWLKTETVAFRSGEAS